MNDLNNIIAALGLDKCQTDKERAAILQEEIARREAELNPIKETYRNVFGRIVDEWYDEFATKFPDLVPESFKLDNWIQTIVNYDSARCTIIIGKVENELLCLVIIKLKDPKNDRHIIDKLAIECPKNYRWKRENIISEWFGINDFDAAFSYFCKIVGRFWELQKAEKQS
ncbi:MAG: hypothetical protein J6W13_04895 [Salinivirgaceae bacterium]|nr:hypothetical protein [Salinivirgaceae bacterium]